MNDPAPNMNELPFYQVQHPIVEQYRTMLETLGKGSSRRLSFLVPENAIAYFFSQNTVFNWELPYFLFRSEEFFKMLQADATLLDSAPEEEQRNTAPSGNNWERTVYPVCADRSDHLCRLHRHGLPFC